MDQKENSLPQHINTLLNSPSTQVELKSLKQVYDCLKTLSNQTYNVEVENDLISFKLFLDADDVNPFPEVTVDEFCKNQNVLNRITAYIFDRRYGWSEADQYDGRRMRRLSCSGVTLQASDGQQKAAINDLLDNIIRWYKYQDLSESLLEAFHYTLTQASNMPVVRSRTVVHMMEWLKESRDNFATFLSTHIILDLVTMAITDVWSAIRSVCAKQLHHVAGFFTLRDQEKLFSELVKICKCVDSTWQAKEGAIMGINAMVHQYQDKVDSRSQTPQFKLENDYQVDTDRSIPDFISGCIHDVVFSLLSHPQLTIRENAGKALSTYISSSDVKEALSTFEQVISLLWLGVETKSDKESIHSVRLPVKYLDAYAAEGFIGVCVFLVKVLPLTQLLPRWPHYMSTFLLYLSHPASTVRQATSSIFKYFVAKSSHCAVLVKFTLQSLIDGWTPDIDNLSKETRLYDHSNSRLLHGTQRHSISDQVDIPLTETWESREGRLFAYELILKFLIKNHWLYTFGPSGSGFLHENYDADSEEGTKIEPVDSIESYENGEDSLSCSVPNRKLIESLSCVDEHPNEDNPDVDLHHSESEKSFAVRFLTQDVSQVYRAPMLSHRNESVDETSSEGRDSVITQSNHVSLHHGGPSQFDTTFSVLKQLQVLDKACSKGPLDTGSHIKSCQSIQRKALEKLAKSIGERRGKNDITFSWVNCFEIQNFSHILVTMLMETLECLADSRWELPRMAQQVLPCLSEVIRWYDMGILEKLWKLELSHRTSVLTYASALLLRDSVVHSVKLQPLIQKPPSSWQDHVACRKIISKIVNRVSAQLPSCLPCLDRIIQRLSYDRLSIIAANTIITAHNHFSITADQKVSQIATVLSFWKLLFSFTHPNTRISKELLQGAVDIKLFNSPFEGYLSCCLVKPENKLQCAKQVEKLFVFDTHGEIKLYLQSLPVETSSYLLPVIAHYTGLFIEDTHICKAMSECLSCLSNKVVEYTSNELKEEQKQTCLKCIHLTLKELAAIITMKSSELHLVQKVLDIYLVLCKAINPVRHLRMILVAICSRVNEGVFFSVEHSPRPDDDLTLLSNDIPLSSSPDNVSEWDHDEHEIIGSPGKFPESMTLNLSNNSGSLPSGRLSSLSQHSEGLRNKSPIPSDKEDGGGEDEEEDGSSDWDSWDDEDEGQSALTKAFIEFLQKLKRMCTSGSSDIFSLELRKLEEREQSLIIEMIGG